MSVVILLRLTKKFSYSKLFKHTLYSEQCTGYSFLTYINISRLSFYANSPQIENKHAHNVLINLPAYSKTTVDIRKLVLEYSPKEKNNRRDSKDDDIQHCEKRVLTRIDQGFENFSQLLKNIESCAKIESIVSSKMLNYISSKLYQVSDNELLELLLTLIGTASKYPDTYKENCLIFKKLSKECIKRSKCWNENQIILFADIWYALNIPLSVQYHSHAIKMLFAKPKTLDPHQFTQCFFYLNLIRHYNFDTQQPIIEEKIGDVLKWIGIEELGIIAMGLFKTKNIIKNIHLLNRVVSQVVTHKESVSAISLCSILKLLRQSFNGLHQEHIKLCSIVMYELRSEIKHMNNFCLIQLASIGNHLNLYEEELLNHVIDQLVPNFPSLRIKDLERITFIVMNSRTTLINCHNFTLLLEQELQSPKRSEEIQYHFSPLLSCVYYLACMGHYNSFLISEALRLNDLSLVQSTKKAFITKPTRHRHLYYLDMMLQIEGPENYQEYKLCRSYSKSLMKEYLPRFPSEAWSRTSLEEMFTELNEIMLRMMKKEFMEVSFILPICSLPGILFCTDGMGNLEPFPRKDFNYAAEEVKHIISSQKCLVWHSFILVGKKSFIHGRNKLRGTISVEIRLLEKLGYNIIIVDSRSFDDNLTMEEKSKQILKCVNKCVNEKWFKKLEKNLIT